MNNTTQKLSYPIKDYSTFAKIIADKTRYGIGDAYPIVKEVLFLMKNNLDVTVLIQSFGLQQQYIYALPVGKKENLLERLREQLKDPIFGYNSKNIIEINNDWLKKQIKYKL
jgi:ABC-type amino acid transport substrate-binding protein